MKYGTVVVLDTVFTTIDFGLRVGFGVWVGIGDGDELGVMF